MEVTNTIIAGSTGRPCSGAILDGGHNLQFPGTSCGETIQSLDPKLDPAGLTDNGGATQTIALLPGSPAINAGDPEVCANPPVNGVDQRGFVRPGSGHTQCSIGAYEADGFSPESCVGDCDGTGSVTVDEIITMVNIALGTISVAGCGSGDANHDNQVTIDEILTAVNAALNGCPAPPMPTPRFLTEDPTLYDYWPCFSPDGRSLLFSRTADGVHWELRLVPVAGGPSVSFASTPLPVSGTRANWSPSGDRIAFTGVSANGLAALWLISATGADAHRITVGGLSSVISRLIRAKRHKIPPPSQVFQGLDAFRLHCRAFQCST